MNISLQMVSDLTTTHLADKANKVSGAKAFSSGTYIVVGLLSLVILVLIYKNFDKIADLIFRRKK
jgi:hypothetical protein